MTPLTHVDPATKARVLKLNTGHGTIETPFLMPVATKGTGKFTSIEQLNEISDAIICNSFLLSLQPGTEIIKKAGGIHKFIGYKHLIFTDNGAFQMLRPSFFIGSSMQGISLKDPFSEKKLLLSAKDSARIQGDIGSDAAMALDDVPEFGQSFDQIKTSLIRTMHWHSEFKEEFVKRKNTGMLTNPDQLVFGIIHGGVYPELRKKSAEKINSMNFDGIAIGGLCIGEDLKLMHEMVRISTQNIDKNKPLYLMGVGSPADLLDCIAKGIDIFDSAFPTQNGRHNTLFTWSGKVKITNQKYREDLGPIDEECKCFVCKNYSRAYLHHLAKLEEPTAKILNSYHNLFFTKELMKKAREAIKKQEFEEFRKEFKERFV